MKLFDSEIGACSIAGMVGCGFPDTNQSPGAEFLLDLRNAVNEVADSVTGGQDEDEAILELAESCVPVYTHSQWQIFTDLQLYMNDLEIDGLDISELAGVALSQFAVEALTTLVGVAKGEI